MTRGTGTSRSTRIAHVRVGRESWAGPEDATRRAGHARPLPAAFGIHRGGRGHRSAASLDRLRRTTSWRGPGPSAVRGGVAVRCRVGRAPTSVALVGSEGSSGHQRHTLRVRACPPTDATRVVLPLVEERGVRRSVGWSRRGPPRTWARLSDEEETSSAWRSRRVGASRRLAARPPARGPRGAAGPFGFEGDGRAVDGGGGAAELLAAGGSRWEKAGRACCENASPIRTCATSCSTARDVETLETAGRWRGWAPSRRSRGRCVPRDRRDAAARDGNVSHLNLGRVALLTFMRAGTGAELSSGARQGRRMRCDSLGGGKITHHHAVGRTRSLAAGGGGRAGGGFAGSKDELDRAGS